MGGTAVAHIIDDLKRRPSRNWSIVITIFGDAIVPRGGSVWLGTLLDFFRHDRHRRGRGAHGDVAAGDRWMAGAGARGSQQLLPADRTRARRPSWWPRGRSTAPADRNGMAASTPSSWKRTAQRPGSASRPAGGGRLRRGIARGLMLAPPGLDGSRNRGGMPWLRVWRRRGCLPGWRRPPGRSSRPAIAFARFVTAFSPLDAALAERRHADGRAGDGGAHPAHPRISAAGAALSPAAARTAAGGWPGEEAALRTCRRLYHALLPQAENWLDRYGRSQDGPLPPADPAIHGSASRPESRP
jgi:phenylacetic acid degradation operon negative regulatory protein